MENSMVLSLQQVYAQLVKTNTEGSAPAFFKCKHQFHVTLVYTVFRGCLRAKRTFESTYIFHILYLLLEH